MSKLEIKGLYIYVCYINGDAQGGQGRHLTVKAPIN